MHFFPFLHQEKYLTLIVFDWRAFMDFAFLLGATLLWVVTVLLVKGFERLEKPTKG
jgi:hypothetical protein